MVVGHVAAAIAKELSADLGAFFSCLISCTHLAKKFFGCKNGQGAAFFGGEVEPGPLLLDFGSCAAQRQNGGQNQGEKQFFADMSQDQSPKCLRHIVAFSFAPAGLEAIFQEDLISSGDEL